MSSLNARKRTSRLSLAISVVLHSAIVIALVVFAAREGMLGKQLKKLSITIVPKEPPPEKPKEKPVEPKPLVEQPKANPNPTPATPNPEPPKTLASAPPVSAPPPAVAPSVAPPPAELASFDFDGGKPVESSSDPNVLYKTFVEYTLRANWLRPEGLEDYSFSAEVEVSLSPEGAILETRWLKGSGDTAWDNSVKRVLAQTKSLGRRPPKGFPGKVLVRFDVQRLADASIQ